MNRPTIMRGPFGIANKGEVAIHTESKPKQAVFGRFIGLAIDGEAVKWRNYEWINDVLHSVFERTENR